MIKGIEKLTEEQRKLMRKVNEKQGQVVGRDNKSGMEIKEVWIDEGKNVCVRLKNGEWYHYTEKGTWY